MTQSRLGISRAGCSARRAGPQSHEDRLKLRDDDDHDDGDHDFNRIGENPKIFGEIIRNHVLLRLTYSAINVPTMPASLCPGTLQ